MRAYDPSEDCFSSVREHVIFNVGRFYPDTSTPKSACTIYFMDSLNIAKRWFSHHVELLRVQLVATKSEHSIDLGVIQYGCARPMRMGRSIGEWLKDPTIFVPPGISPSFLLGVLMGVPEIASD